MTNPTVAQPTDRRKQIDEDAATLRDVIRCAGLDHWERYTKLGQRRAGTALRRLVALAKDASQ